MMFRGQAACASHVVDGKFSRHILSDADVVTQAVLLAQVLHLNLHTAHFVPPSVAQVWQAMISPFPRIAHVCQGLVQTMQKLTSHNLRLPNSALACVGLASACKTSVFHNSNKPNNL